MVAEILGRIWSEEPQLFHSYGSYGRFIPIYQLFWFVLPRSHPTSRTRESHVSKSSTMGSRNGRPLPRRSPCTISEVLWPRDSPSPLEAQGHGSLCQDLFSWLIYQLAIGSRPSVSMTIPIKYLVWEFYQFFWVLGGLGILYYIILYYIILYYNYIILYYIILCYIILYYIILYSLCMYSMHMLMWCAQIPGYY